MNSSRRTMTILFAVLCCAGFFVKAENDADRRIQQRREYSGSPSSANAAEDDTLHARSKRTLLLKKKIIGAGILGLGIGAIKGYKLARHHAPEVHHVYLAPPPPPVKYIEFVEKPVFVEHHKPVLHHDVHHEHHEHHDFHEEPEWHHDDHLEFSPDSW